MHKDKKRIKIDILEKFKELEDEANLLPEEWLKNEYFIRLNTHEKKAFKCAVRELAASGLIECTPGLVPEVKLTPLGENLIFA